MSDQPQKTEKECVETDLAFSWLCKELENAAEKGHILQLIDVWNRYVELAEELAIDIPQSFISRRATFKAKLESKFDDIFQIFKPLNVSTTERQTLLIPSKFQTEKIFQTTAQAEDDLLETLSISKYRPEHEDAGAVIPKNFVPNKCIHFTADNIDILDESLDGKNTFHATQMAAYQRGVNRNQNALAEIEKSTAEILKVPEILQDIVPMRMIEGKAKPVFQKPVTINCFRNDHNKSEPQRKPEVLDQAFFVYRQELLQKPGWTSFNQKQSTTEPNETSIGHMPIILAPAHEFDTLNTVVKLCMFVSEHFGQTYTVITVDQALYCKLMELKWKIPDFNVKLTVRLGGLHIWMSFLKAIGKHMAGNGLYEAWIESGLLGEGAAELVFSGKAYSKAMRTHKITVQALWKILMPKLMAFLAESNKELDRKICSVIKNNNEIIMLDSMLQEDQYCRALAEFVETESKKNVNFKFWWQYIEMFSILLLFTRAQREGIWELHLTSFTKMIPLFMRYDHYNYARWRTIYVAEMKQLPEEVKEEFVKGDFVVKCSANKFNQVDPDHAQEWLNGTGKRAGGIVGVTKTISVLMR